MTRLGDSVGSPQQQSSFEMQTTASTEVAKGGMKIALDTLEAGISLIVLDRGNQSGSPPTNPNRPVLAPLINVRVATSFPSLPDQSWQSAINDLINLMPKDFRDQLVAMLMLPKDQQDPDFQLLLNTLQSASTLMTLFETSTAPVDSESTAGVRAAANLLLPYLALSGSSQQGQTLLDAMQSFLETVGLNDPNFDALAGYATSLAPLTEDINTAIQMLQDPTTEQAGKILLSNTADQLNSLADNFDRLYAGSDMQILGNTLHATALSAEALSLGQPGSAALLIALSLATAGINNSESNLGLIGDGFSTMKNAFSDAIIATAGSRLPAGTPALINEFATVMLATFFLAGSFTHDAVALNPSFANAKDQTPPEVIADRNFSYSLLVSLISNSNVLNNISKQLLQAADVKGEALSQTTTLFASMLSLTLVFAGISGLSLTTTEALIKSQANSLKDGTEFAANLIGSGDLSSEDLANLNVYFKQASIALEQENGEGFLDALNSILGTIGTTNSALANSLNELKDLAVVFKNALSTSADELSTNTGIHVAA